MSDDRHVIWSNWNLDYEDWKADLEEYYPDEPFPVSWTVKSGKKQNETQDIS